MRPVQSGFGRRRTGGAGKVVAVVLILVVLGTLAFAFLSPPTSGPIGQIQSLFGRGAAVLGSITSLSTSSHSTGTSSLSLQSSMSSSTTNTYTISHDWALSFISTVNAKRGTPLTESPSLDHFASIRYAALTSHYQISHYGYHQDFQSFFSGQSITASEEYFAPNVSPSAFALDLQQNATVHWQGLIDNTFTKFGFYIGPGLDYVIHQPCSVREIVGSVNQTQLLIQHNCTFTIATVTYLVVELSS